MQGSLVREAAVADTGPPFLNVKSGVDLGNILKGTHVRGHNLNLRVHILDAFQIPYQEIIDIGRIHGTYKS